MCFFLGEKPFKCEICQRGYSSRVHVRSHLEREHLGMGGARERKKPGPKPKHLRDELEEQRKIIEHLQQQLDKTKALAMAAGNINAIEELQQNNETTTITTTKIAITNQELVHNNENKQDKKEKEKEEEEKAKKCDDVIHEKSAEILKETEEHEMSNKQIQQQQQQQQTQKQQQLTIMSQIQQQQQQQQHQTKLQDDEINGNKIICGIADKSRGRRRRVLQSSPQATAVSVTVSMQLQGNVVQAAESGDDNMEPQLLELDVGGAVVGALPEKENDNLTLLSTAAAVAAATPVQNAHNSALKENVVGVKKERKINSYYATVAQKAEHAST